MATWRFEVAAQRQHAVADRAPCVGAHAAIRYRVVRVHPHPARGTVTFECEQMVNVSPGLPRRPKAEHHPHATLALFRGTSSPSWHACKLNRSRARGLPTLRMGDALVLLRRARVWAGPWLNCCGRFFAERADRRLRSSARDPVHGALVASGRCC